MYLMHPGIMSMQLPLKRVVFGGQRMQVPDWYSRHSFSKATVSRNSVKTATWIDVGIFDFIRKSKFKEKQLTV